MTLSYLEQNLDSLEDFRSLIGDLEEDPDYDSTVIYEEGEMRVEGEEAIDEIDLLEKKLDEAPYWWEKDAEMREDEDGFVVDMEVNYHLSSEIMDSRDDGVSIANIHLTAYRDDGAEAEVSEESGLDKESVPV